MRTLHRVHGYNVRDFGDGTIKCLDPYCPEGWSQYDQSYGFFNLLNVWFNNDDISRKIANRVQEGDIGVGHSNGCPILVNAVRKFHAPFEGLVLINPALERTLEFPIGLKFIHVYYNYYDRVVTLSQLLDWLPWHWRHGHFWGDMGRWGPTSDDPRILRVNCGRFAVRGHSDVFWHTDRIGPIYRDNLLKATGEYWAGYGGADQEVA